MPTNNLFDPIAWMDGQLPFSSGNLYERRLGFPFASVVLDTTPPSGEVILNEDTASGGLLIHHFTAYGTPPVNTSLTQDVVLTNNLEAIKFYSNEEQNVGTINVSIKGIPDGTGGTGTSTSPIFTNGTDNITAYVYLDNNGVPGVAVANSTNNISYSQLGTSYAVATFNLAYDFLANTVYWIILEKSNPQLGGNITLLGYNSGINSHATSVDGISWSLLNNQDCNIQYIGVSVSYPAVVGVNNSQDALGNVVGQAFNFGGTNNPYQYETIGYGSKRSLVKQFLQPYGSVNQIEFCVTSVTPKAYVLEVQTVSSPSWTPVLYMISNEQTLNYFRYEFSSAVVLTAIRIRYRGDYYTTLDNGKVTVSAFDNMTGVQSVMLSHYPDFRDAADFPNANINGWILFTDGTSIYNWAMVNNARTWTALNGTASSGLDFCLALQTTLISTGNGSFYIFSPVTPLTLQYTTTDNSKAMCYAKLNGVYYFGMSNGYILSTISGNNYTVVNPTSQVVFTSNGTSTPLSITSLTSFAGKLYIGTQAPVGGQASLYVYDPTTSLLTLARSFSQRSVNSLTAANGFLFVGVGGDLNSNSAGVYIYDGKAWALSFSPIGDSIDVVFYSTADSKVWAALTGGLLYTLPFTNGVAGNWTQSYSGDAHKYTSLSNDNKNTILWTTSSTGILAYVPSQNTFVSVIEPVANTNPIITSITYLGNVGYGSATDGNIYQFNVADITSKKRTVYARFMDNAGNTTPLPGVTDDVLQDTQTVNGVKISTGNLWQVNSVDKTVLATFTPSVSAPLFAPDRTMTETGTYVSEPFFAATLARWDALSILATLPAGSGSVNGLSSGTEIDIYIKTGDTRSDVMNADWGVPFVQSTINNPSAAFIGATNSFNISTLNGKWLQYKIVLVSASKAITPILQGVTLTYTASQASYFFTTMFSTETYVTGPNPPQFKRGLLVSNMIDNGGQIVFGYTTDPTDGNTYDFGQFTQIQPNEIFELPVWSDSIRFGILLVSLNTGTPAIVDEFAVMLDTSTQFITPMKNT